MMTTGISNAAKLDALIYGLSFLITIGKYLPLMVGLFATFNLILAYLDLFIWGHILPGVINSAMALGGFMFLVQLLKRRRIHRYEYRYRGRHFREGQGKSREVVAN